MHRRSVLLGLASGLPLLKGLPLYAATGDGFSVPPEESPHARTFMQWPANPAVHDDAEFLRILQGTVAGVANATADFEPVVMLAAQDQHALARKVLSDKVELWDVPTDDLRCRDSGPIFVRNAAGDLAIRQIQFNGWGNRQVHDNDAKVAATLAERLGLPLLPTGLKGEAGGVEQDGHGLLIAHESSWVHDNRNPGMTRDLIEAALLAAYGADWMIWAPGLKDEDITDYHIDSLARLTGQDAEGHARVLINMPQEIDADDPFHQAALVTRDRLIDAGLVVDVIPEPNRRRVKSVDFVASYANFYLCNGAIIAAEFGDKETDAMAVAALKRHFPGREVVTLNVDAIGEVGGGIHCATHEMPAT